jgi:hypothetical protein
MWVGTCCWQDVTAHWKVLGDFRKWEGSRAGISGAIHSLFYLRAVALCLYFTLCVQGFLWADPFKLLWLRRGRDGGTELPLLCSDSVPWCFYSKYPFIETIIKVVAHSTNLFLWGLNSGLQVLYHLSHTPSPFCFRFFFFSDLAYIFALAALDLNRPTYTSCVTEITSFSNHTQLICWDGVSLAFLFGLVWIFNPPVEMCTPK